MAKLDLKKKYKSLFGQTSKEFLVIDVPPANFLMIDGVGDPNTAPEYKEKISLLYGVAYTIKFLISKKDPAKDYVVPPLEGLWWCDNMELFSADRKDEWKWRMMIMQPDFVTQDVVREGIAAYCKKNKLSDAPGISLTEYHEGKAVQVLYQGPYTAETEVIKAMHAYIKSIGELRGLHHEIYLNNPEKTEPSKLKTLIRQPVKIRS